MRRILLAAAAMLGFTLLPPPTGGGPLQAQEAAPDTVREAEADTAAVLAAVRAMLEGITTGDTTLLRSVTAPDLRLEGTTTRGSPPPTPAGQSRGEFLAMVSRPDAGFVERMWSPTVRIHGRIADVHAPYDFYQGGEFSHCGIDLFQLVRTSEGWKVVSVIWTAEQPPACERHPDGPPSEAGRSPGPSGQQMRPLSPAASFACHDDSPRRTSSTAEPRAACGRGAGDRPRALPGLRRR